MYLQDEKNLKEIGYVGGMAPTYKIAMFDVLQLQGGYLPSI